MYYSIAIYHTLRLFTTKVDKYKKNNTSSQIITQTHSTCTHTRKYDTSPTT